MFLVEPARTRSSTDQVTRKIQPRAAKGYCRPAHKVLETPDRFDICSWMPLHPIDFRVLANLCCQSNLHPLPSLEMKFLGTCPVVAQQDENEHRDEDHVRQSKRTVIACYILCVWKRITKSTSTVVPDAGDAAPGLPHIGCFRTSLILPALCTRFSLLRERSDGTEGIPDNNGIVLCKRTSLIWFAKFNPADGGFGSQAREVSRSPFEIIDRSTSGMAGDANYGGDTGGQEAFQEGRDPLYEHLEQVSLTNSRHSKTCCGLTLFEEDASGLPSALNTNPDLLTLIQRHLRGEEGAQASSWLSDDHLSDFSDGTVATSTCTSEGSSAYGQSYSPSMYSDSWELEVSKDRAGLY